MEDSRWEEVVREGGGYGGFMEESREEKREREET